MIDEIINILLLSFDLIKICSIFFCSNSLVGFITKNLLTFLSLIENLLFCPNFVLVVFAADSGKVEPTVDLTKTDDIMVVENTVKNAKKDETKEKAAKLSEEENKDGLEKLLGGFVLFYDANKDSKIDKDDWFTALRNSFEASKYGALEVINENIRPLRT